MAEAGTRGFVGDVKSATMSNIHPISERKKARSGTCEGFMFHIGCKVENRFLFIVGVGIEGRMDFLLRR